MNIWVNGGSYQLEQSLTVSELIMRLNIGPRRMAIEVNREIVPRTEYSTFHLKPGDKVEVIEAVGGG